MDSKSWHSLAPNARMFGTIACIWIAIIALSYSWNWYQTAKSAVMFAEAEARASHDKDLVYRRWGALQGGVYVPPTETTPANPYLSHLPDRDLVTTEGKRLTLVNPAYMTRQVLLLAKEQGGTFGHITSLTPLNPINAADSWEAEALRLFEKGTREIFTKESVNGQDYIRLMRPMITEKPCLKCHAVQGYTEGHIRGGISVSVPFASYASAAGQQQLQLLWAHVIIACVGLLGLWKGITLLQSTAVSLSRSKDLHDNLLHTAMDGFWSADATGRLLEVNETYCRMSGYSEQELLTMKIHDLEANESADDTATNLLRVFYQGEDRFETKHRHKNGTLLDIEVSARHDQSNEERILVFLRDITEQKKAEKLLTESHELLNNLACMVPGVIYQYRLYPDGRSAFPYASPGIYSIYEVTPKEVREDATPVFGRLHPEDRERVTDDIYESARTLETFYCEYRVILPQQGLRWRWSQAQPQRMEDGSILWHGIISDTTDQKRAEKEKEKLHSQLNQAQKMESVGRLAGGVAHDYNNMLSVILGYTEMALERVKPEDPLWADLKEILKATNRSADITRQLLAFSRRQVIAPKKLDLNATVEGMLRMLRRLIGEDIDLVWKPKVNVWSIKMDPSQLDQILVNLCVNARDAISDVGKITIETGVKTFDKAYCDDHAEYLPGNYVLLAVSDDGCGMSKETQENLFEPFFTTKEMGKGTGLGLATVYGIVKQNWGFINVYSEPGQGSSFKIYLPRDASAVEPLSKAPGTIMDLHGKETILLVEDEEKVLEMTTEILERLGYHVIVAGTPDEAIELARSISCKIHLLMTDVVMPKMNGRQLAQQLQSSYPNLKVLFMSGYTAHFIAHHGVLEEGVNFIQKPFLKNDLSIRLREVLDASI